MSKMKTKRWFLSSILIICMIFSLQIPVFAETSGEYTYSINSDNLTCTITKYNGAGGDVTIPSSLDAYTVTAIGNNAFMEVTTLNNITIPNSVTSMGKQAFANCRYLISVTIPNSITSIPIYAFSGCLRLSSITIPNSVTSIERGAFYACGNLNNVIIPNSVTSIENETFVWCTSLESITIPNRVTSIEASTFSQCNALKNVIIPNSVTSIKSHAFVGCKALESITIPKSIMSIGDLAFFNCEKLTSIYFDGTPSLGDSVFNGCPSELVGYSPTGESLPGITCQTATTHSITVNSVSNGAIVPSALLGMKEATISLQIVPDEGYTSDPTLLKYNNGTSDAVISGTSFKMPDNDITISGGFQKISIPTVTSPSATIDYPTPTWGWVSATGEGYYRYKLNEESWNYTTLTNFTPTTNLTNGTYTLYVQEINNNADWSSSGSAAVTVTLAPTVTVTPTNPTVQKGNTQTFSAVVAGTNGPAQTVTWSVLGSVSGTSIDSAGVLTVAEDETASTLTITATSTVDSSKSGTATVVVTPQTYALTISAGTGGSITTGSNGNFAAGTSVNISCNSRCKLRFQRLDIHRRRKLWQYRQRQYHLYHACGCSINYCQLYTQRQFWRWRRQRRKQHTNYRRDLLRKYFSQGFNRNQCDGDIGDSGQSKNGHSCFACRRTARRYYLRWWKCGHYSTLYNWNNYLYHGYSDCLSEHIRRNRHADI